MALGKRKEVAQPLRRSAGGEGQSVLRDGEQGVERASLRLLRRAAVRQVLQGQRRPAGTGAGDLFSLSAGGLL